MSKAFPYPNLYLTFGGAMPLGERWQCGLTIDPGDIVGSQIALEAALNDMVVDLTTWWNSAGIGLLTSTGNTLDFAALYSYPGGNSPAGGVARRTITGLVGAGGTVMPNQVCLVTSLRSVIPSRKGMGRIYLPCSGITASGGNIASGDALAVATATAALLTALNANINTGSVVAGSEGQPITTVVVDTRFDTQRRRTRQQGSLAPQAAAVT